MNKSYPKEFRDDVVRAAKMRDPGVTLEQAALEYGIDPATLSDWLHEAGQGECADPINLRDELVKANRRVQLLEEENEVLRKAAAYLFGANLAETNVS